MSVQKITTDELRRMSDQEGLILRGCGGDPQEWVDGINEMLVVDGVFKKGAGFQEAYSFKHDGVTCLLFPFNEKIEMDVRKLALWRLQTHQIFGSTWLSDYVPNELGGFLPKESEQSRQKPDCPLIGRDSNVFNLMGIAGRTLREHGMEEQAQEMLQRITQCQSYDSALNIISDYVNIVPKEQNESMDMEMQ